MKLKLNLSNRISLGYIIIIAIALMATLYCVYTLQTNKELSKRIQTVNLPVYLRLKDLNAISLEAQKLINDWVYQPSPEEKNALLALQNESYPKLRKNIQDIVNHSKDAGIDSVKSVLAMFDDILGSQRSVMNILNADSLYSNDHAVDRAIDLYDHTITPASQQLGIRLDKLLLAQEEEINELQTEKESADTFLTILLFLMILVFVIAAVVAYFYARRTIIDPIVKAKNFIVALGQGKSVDIDVSNREDEIGEMMIAMRNLTEGINAKSEFALSIGQGKYDAQFALLGDEDRMGRALLDMRASLKENAESEQRRNWATQGLAEIGAILRDHTDKLSEFYNAIIRYVVKYMGANQGGIFLLVNPEKEEPYLELMACYAYERKKIIEKKLGIGEGLLGQCVLEKQTVNMRKLPGNYIRITSGLGEAPPSNLVIVPLKINDEVQGVMEIASFHKFEPFQIDFLEKLAENIAASMAAVQINKRTQHLLDQSQQQGEQMKANQEELRQSMEELSATQEEMSRKEREYLKKIADLEEALNRRTTAHTFQGNNNLVPAPR
jgi:hypothetical protein